jgi:hypothetical protein
LGGERLQGDSGLGGPAPASVSVSASVRLASTAGCCNSMAPTSAACPIYVARRRRSTVVEIGRPLTVASRVAECSDKLCNDAGPAIGGCDDLVHVAVRGRTGSHHTAGGDEVHSGVILCEPSSFVTPVSWPPNASTRRVLLGDQGQGVVDVVLAYAVAGALVVGAVGGGGGEGGVRVVGADAEGEELPVPSV